jgi:hypothetical protein
MTMAMVAVTFCGQAWMGAVAPAQAATVIDTFQLKATVIQRCQGDPRFVEIFDVKAVEGNTVTITRDVNNDGDLTTIQTTINNTGNVDIDAITMNGRIFPKNLSGSAAKFVLSGSVANPGSSDNFITILGNATFNAAGNLTKAAGTFVFQITDNYRLPGGGESLPAECIEKGTFETKAKLP